METAAGVEKRRSMGQDGPPNKPLRRVVFYWLCDGCAAKMTLAYDKEGGIGVRPIAQARSAVA